MELAVVKLEPSATSPDHSFSSLDLSFENKKPTILTSFPNTEFCVVCGDRASGRHYGAISCEGCKGFFKRSIRKQLGYTCRGNQSCEVTKHHRNRCQYCRLQKCLQMGMRSDSVQHERKPLNGQIKKELTLKGECYNNSSGSGSISPTNGQNSDNNMGVSVDFALCAGKSNIDQLFINDTSSNPDIDEGSQDDVEADLNSEKEIIGRAVDTISSVINDNRDQCGDIDPMFESIDKDVLIPEECAFFTYVGPLLNLPNGLINVEFVCETGSRLLFLTVNWMKNLPVFKCLTSEMQIELLRDCWSELFVIGFVQCDDIITLANVLSALLVHLQQSCTSTRLVCLANNSALLRQVIKSIETLNLDDYEYSVLKALCVFSPDRFVRYSSSVVEAVREIRNNLIRQLQEYENISKLGEDSICAVEDTRAADIISVLPTFRTVTSDVVEDLFFTNLLGETQVSSLIPFILNSNMDLNSFDNGGDGPENIDDDGESSS